MQTGLAVTVLMIVVLAVRGLVTRFFGAGWAYALWAIPALRLVLPPLPQLAQDIPPVVIFIPATAGMTAPLPAEAGPGQWLPLILAMWAGGAVIFLTWQWLSYRAFLRRLDMTARPARPPEYGGIATFVSEAVEGPVALGAWVRRIVLPTDFSRRYSPDERRLALEHELVHHRRGDIWWNFAALAILSLNWFNPVAWIAFRAFRTDQELACDAVVARRASAQERHDYARALVKSATQPGLIAACPLNGADQLKQRLRMMRSHRVSMARSAGGVAAVASLGCAALAFGGAGYSQRPEVVYVQAPAKARAAVPVREAAAAAPAKAVAREPVKLARAQVQRSRPKPVRAAAPAPAAKAEPAPLSPAAERLQPLLASLAVDPAPAARPALLVRTAQLAPPAPTRFRTHVVAQVRHNAAGQRVVIVDGDVSDAERIAIAAQIEEAIGRAEVRRAMRLASSEATAKLARLQSFQFEIHKVRKGD
jgi:beta-lactamase regulating signal transducer with metallopeptidase domain